MSAYPIHRMYRADERLREALDEAQKYEDMYISLLDTHRELVERESLVTEEAERLGAQNAELIGHSNGDQKINYVEGVRREMAFTRHVSDSGLPDKGK